MFFASSEYLPAARLNGHTLNDMRFQTYINLNTLLTVSLHSLAAIRAVTIGTPVIAVMGALAV